LINRVKRYPRFGRDYECTSALSVHSTLLYRTRLCFIVKAPAATTDHASLEQHFHSGHPHRTAGLWVIRPSSPRLLLFESIMWTVVEVWCRSLPRSVTTLTRILGGDPTPFPSQLFGEGCKEKESVRPSGAWGGKSPFLACPS
jgi:hypothetical protein